MEERRKGGLTAPKRFRGALKMQWEGECCYFFSSRNEKEKSLQGDTYRRHSRWNEAGASLNTDPSSDERQMRLNIGALGSVANHPLEKAEVIADSLQKQFEPNTEAENDRFTARTQRKTKRFLFAPTCLDLEKTTPGEVQEYIKKLNINKSPGLHLITNRILKKCPPQICSFYCHVVQSIDGELSFL
ncbi:hypothetical protein TNCV_4105601 [Trichonephila clavipes]|nr:hypothetical protein TNCV_4105601 [Trichonephila clavipes]